MKASRFTAVTLMALTLAACATTPGEFPSLERRPAERIAGSSEVAVADISAPAIAPPIAPDLPGRLAQIEARAEAGHTRFLAREPSARRMVAAARGAGVATESWSVATVAVAELEGARSLVMIALADLDSLYAAERIAGRDAAAVAEVRERVTALVVQEDSVLAQLGTALKD